MRSAGFNGTYFYFTRYLIKGTNFKVIPAPRIAYDRVLCAALFYYFLNTMIQLVWVSKPNFQS
mgnify:CR=1 FL=1